MTNTADATVTLPLSTLAAALAPTRKVTLSFRFVDESTGMPGIAADTTTDVPVEAAQAESIANIWVGPVGNFGRWVLDGITL